MATTRLQRYASGKTLDEATRESRHQKALDSLEQDNHHEDPHADMKVVKKAARTRVVLNDTTTTEETDESDDSDDWARQPRKKVLTKRAPRRPPSPGYYKEKFGQDLTTLIKIQQRDDPVGPNYVTAAAPPPKYPARNFCSVCGFPCDYKCAQCGAKFCSVKCLDTHKATRCQKFVA